MDFNFLKRAAWKCPEIEFKKNKNSSIIEVTIYFFFG